MFSLLPRCQGEWGSRKYTSMPVLMVNCACAAISFALVPGDACAEEFGQGLHFTGEEDSDAFGGTVVGDAH